MTNKKCPECGSPMKVCHEPQTQEYPGATPTPASSMLQCTNPDCFYDEEYQTHPINWGSVQENYRGW